MNEIISKLMAPFQSNILEEVPGRGGKYLYPPVDKAILRAIEVWGENWSFVVEKSWVELGTALVQGYVQDPNGNKRSSVAGKIIEMKSDKPTDLGDDFKGATSYCLRKCLWAFGIGLYLSDKRTTQTDKKSGNVKTPPTAKPDAPAPVVDPIKQAKRDLLEAWKSAGYTDDENFTLLKDYMQQETNKAPANMTLEDYAGLTAKLKKISEEAV